MSDRLPPELASVLNKGHELADLAERALDMGHQIAELESSAAAARNAMGSFVTAQDMVVTARLEPDMPIEWQPPGADQAENWTPMDEEQRRTLGEGVLFIGTQVGPVPGRNDWMEHHQTQIVANTHDRTWRIRLDAGGVEGTSLDYVDTDDPTLRQTFPPLSEVIITPANSSQGPDEHAH